MEQGGRWSLVVQKGLRQNRGAELPELVKWRHLLHRRLATTVAAEDECSKSSMEGV